MKLKYSDISHKICDSHVHYGNFRDEIYDENSIVKYFDDLEIEKVGLMPTSPNWELNQIYNTNSIDRFPRDKYVHYLWVSPDMIDSDSTLETFNLSRFKVLKIHAYAQKEWCLMSEKIRLVIQVAYRNDIPVMFHTGGWRGSNAIQFYKYCREFPEVKFILAHGRPFSQTLTILKGTKNTYVDNSFMMNDSLKLLCDNGFSDRILFATDFPIMKSFWPEINLTHWYRNNVMELIKLFGEKNFMIWSNENFHNLICNQ